VSVRQGYWVGRGLGCQAKAFCFLFLNEVQREGNLEQTINQLTDLCSHGDLFATD
jgi:hypothetical protein